MGGFDNELKCRLITTATYIKKWREQITKGKERERERKWSEWSLINMGKMAGINRRISCSEAVMATLSMTKELQRLGQS